MKSYVNNHVNILYMFICAFLISYNASIGNAFLTSVDVTKINSKYSSVLKFSKLKDEEEEKPFDGYDMRDAIFEKFGKCFDMDFRRVDNMGKRDLYLNVMPFHLNSRRFRHASELDYLCHLQAIVEILTKYDRLDYVLAQMQETTKKPRASTSPLIAVPFRLDLSEDELDMILGDV